MFFRIQKKSLFRTATTNFAHNRNLQTRAFYIETITAHFIDDVLQKHLGSASGLSNTRIIVTRVHYVVPFGK